MSDLLYLHPTFNCSLSSPTSLLFACYQCACIVAKGTTQRRGSSSPKPTRFRLCGNYHVFSTCTPQVVAACFHPYLFFSLLLMRMYCCTWDNIFTLKLGTEIVLPLRHLYPIFKIYTLQVIVAYFRPHNFSLFAINAHVLLHRGHQQR